MALPPLKTEDSAGNTVNAATLQLKVPFGTAKKSGIETEVFNPAYKNRITAPGDAKLGSVVGITSGSYAINVIDDDATDSFATQSAGVEPEVGMAVKLISSGASSAPGSFTYGTTYYVISTNPITLSLTQGGALRNITSPGVGQHVMIPVERPYNVTGTRPAATNVTIAVNTSSPITGAADFTITGSASRIGDYVAWPFTIDQSERGNVLTAKFKYKIDLGDNEGFSAWVRDITNNQLIPVTPEKLLHSQTLSAQFQGTFQASSSSTSYELILFKRVGSGSNLWSSTININEIEVGPQSIARGPMIDEEVTYTPTLVGFGTPSAVSLWSRRNSDRLEIRGKFTSGTSTATEARIPLGYRGASANVTIDSTKVTTISKVGSGSRTNTNGYSLGILAESGVNYLTISIESNALSGLAKANGNALLSTGESISFFASVPIAGWSSSQVLSSEEDGRVCALVVTGANASATTNNLISWPTVYKDTHGGYSAGTYTVKLPGFYQVLAGADGSISLGNALYVSINGNTTAGANRPFLAWAAAANQPLVGSAIVFCNAGDTITIRPTANYGAGSSASNCLQITRISGPSQVSAAESITAAYHLSANFAASTTVPINFDTKEQDSHGAIVPHATTWKFTAPISGIYSVAGFVLSSSGNVSIQVYKNGTAYKMAGHSDSGSSTRGPFSTTVPLLAGEYIDLRPNGSATITGGTKATAGVANVNIVRVGNYA